MDREIALLESDLNCLLREKEVTEQQFNTRRQQLLQLTMNVPPTSQRATELIMQMVQLNSECRRELDKITSQIFFTRHALNRRRSQQGGQM